MGLARHLSGDEPMDPRDAAAWLGSDDGRQFVALSNELWCQASVTAGTPAAEAQQAAERTFGFYTGSGSMPES
jgi:hypothetical protein